MIKWKSYPMSSFCVTLRLNLHLTQSHDSLSWSCDILIQLWHLMSISILGFLYSFFFFLKIGSMLHNFVEMCFRITQTDVYCKSTNLSLLSPGQLSILNTSPSLAWNKIWDLCHGQILADRQGLAMCQTKS